MCIFSKQIWSHFQKTYSKIRFEANFMNGFCDKLVCVCLSEGTEECHYKHFLYKYVNF